MADPAGLLQGALARMSPEVRQDILGALSCLEADPVGGAGVEVQPLRGMEARRQPGVHLAILPHGYCMTYTPLERAAAIPGRRVVRVESLFRVVGESGS
jgi:hypothetical protein